MAPQFILPLAHELVVDLFAGGGGASEGMEQAIGRHVDDAANHDPDAIGQHEVNHPQTRHHLADVRDVDPLQVTEGRPVGLLHASPDCTDHSQAKGGQPREHEIRSLAWVVHRWAGKVKPRVITLENVEQMLQWSPLVAKRDKATGRVVTLDRVRDPATGKTTHRVADPGEQVPRRRQFLVPDKRRRGHNWRHFVDGLRALGYAVQWKVICNADLGAHSTRERLYLVARRDGLPIVWPELTHAKKATKTRKAWRPAHECIDWSIPGKSIFGRERPLAEATMRRIATGMKRFVLDSADPFIVPVKTWGGGGNGPRNINQPMPTITASKRGEFGVVAPTLMPLTHQGGPRNHDPREPLPTVTAAHRGELALTAATLVPVTHSRDTAYDVGAPMRTITTAKGGETALATAVLVGAGGSQYAGKPRCVSEPLGTVLAEDHRAIASAYMVQAGHGEGLGATKRRSHGVNDIEGPIGTVTASGGGQSVATAFMVQANGGFNDTPARDLRSPVSTVTTSGSQQQLITAHLTTLRRNCTGRDMHDPVPTITAGAEHHALVEYHLSQEHEEGALRCAAFLMRYHGTGGQWSDLREPATTVTTHDRLALVTVWLKGEPWVVVDICLRMLVPRELYNAQDFPASYIIDRTATGKRLSKTAQVRMCGNSVSPLPMRLIVGANYSDLALREAA